MFFHANDTYRGFVNTFGTFQDFYATSLLKEQSSSQISWIGTFQGFLLVGFTIISGPLFDLGYSRALVIGGTFLTVFGLFMTSLATEYYQVFLAQGLCVGLGGACIFLPSVAIVATYFTTKRALATGISAAGGSIGSVLYPIIFRKLQPQIGFGWATRVIAFVMLATLLVSIAVLRTRLPPPVKARAALDLKAFRNAPYVLFNIGLFFAFTGFYIPIFYIIIYAQRHAHIDTDMSFYLLSILNAASTFSRVLAGYIADKLGSLEMMILCTLLAGVFSFAWTAINTFAGLVVFAIIYGFLSGVSVSMPPTIIASLVPEMGLIGTWMGMSFCFSGIGILIGGPIAGTIINIVDDDFTGGLIFAGSVTVTGGLAFLAAKILKVIQSRRT